MEIITIGISPNTEYDDVKQALKILFMPWRWYQEDARNQVIDWFKKQFNSRHVTLFSSGRSALTAILESFGIGNGDEVIVQAFTCMVVPNAIRFAGAIPTYVDIDTSANINPLGIEKAITSKTKAIIVQHTFGTPADMDSIMGIARKHKLLVIEDCAHALGATYKGKLLGTIGDAAFFSFGRDKVVSSVQGGVAIRKEIKKQMSEPSLFWIAKQLFHPIAMSIILPLYRIQIGKVMLVILQKLHILTFPVTRGELHGDMPKNYFMQYPNALAYLLLRQLKKLEQYNKNRQNIASQYDQAFLKIPRYQMLSKREGSIYLRYGVLCDHPDAVRKAFQKRGIVLGNWYHNVIDPVGSDLSKSGYIYGSCPKAELLAQQIINLPTRITKTQADEVIRLLKLV